MYRIVVAAGRGHCLPLLHIDWTTVQSEEFAETTVIVPFFFFPSERA